MRPVLPTGNMAKPEQSVDLAPVGAGDQQSSVKPQLTGVVKQPGPQQLRTKTHLYGVSVIGKSLAIIGHLIMLIMAGRLQRYRVWDRLGS